MAEDGEDLANAFGNASSTSTASYWGGPFNQVGKNFLWGFSQSGDPAVGSIRSITFKAIAVLSFLVGGGWDPVNIYVALVRESDGSLIFSQTGTNDEALIRIIWDTSSYSGQNFHMLVYDNSTATSWGRINLDDVRTGCDALGDSGLTFNVLGQDNQPLQNNSSLSAPELYALDSVRPQFHYAPYQGWVNDPCALIEWNGRHQLFSQFNPVAPLWGPMHWSHVDSSDAMHWRELPIVLYPPYPNNPFETSGRYTGSARQDSTGALQVIFTDATDVALNPRALPEVVSNSPSGFRDPNVFLDSTGNTWKMVLGSGDATSGKVQLYKAADVELLTWEYVGVLTEGDGSTGTMWECPNFFLLDGKWVLFYGGDGLGWYEVGTYDGTKLTSEKVGLLDAGPDSYATQWYIDSAGRSLIITWMGNWPTSKWPSRVNGWAGAQSITRSCSCARMVDWEASLLLKWQHLQLYSSSAEQVSLVYTFANKTLTLDTTNAAYGQAGTWNVVIDVPSSNTLTCDVLIDRSSVEVFIGDGTAMTATVFPRYQESTDIKLISRGGKAVFNSIVLTPFGSTWG